MDYLSSKAIKVIEERDIPGQLLLDLGIAPIEKAMGAGLDAVDMALSKPTIETIEEPKKTSKSYSRPTVWDVDDRGEMQPCDRELGGYVSLEDYDVLLGDHEELADECTQLSARLFDIREGEKPASRFNSGRI